MGRLYWLVNCVLLVVVAFATSWVGQQDAEARWTVRPKGGADRSARSKATLAPKRADVGPARASIDGIDVLWRKTLFRPERTEEVAPETVDGEPAPKPTDTDMELTGMGRINEEAAAIILVKRIRTKRPRRGPGAKTPAKPEKTKRVYKLGDEVAGTGYVVKEISFNEVLLVRGNEERTLKLESGDASSEQRRTQAAQAEKRAAVVAAAKTQTTPAKMPAGGTKTQPPPPPPPPPVAGLPTLPTPGASSKAAQMTREERIKRAREIRERMLARRQKTTTK